MTTTITQGAPMRTAEHSSRTHVTSTHAVAVTAVARVLSRTGIKVGVWFWAIYLVYAVGIIVGNRLAGNDLEISALDTTLGSSRWPVLWIGVAMPIAVLGLHLSAGGTRRSLFDGVVRSALVVGVGFGTATTIALLAERALSTSLGMTWRRLGALPFDGVAGVVSTLVAESLVIAAYVLVGAGIGFAYKRHGAARGTLLSVALFVPAVLADVATRTGVIGVIANVRFEPDIENAVVPISQGLAPMLAGVGGAAVAVVLAAVALRFVLRDASLNPPR
jgi:hypothetical protein